MVRLSKNMKMIDVSDKMEPLKEYIRKREEICSVFLYGSYGTKYQTVFSDIDFGILLFKKAEIVEQLELQADISNILKEEDVSLLFLNNAPVAVQFKVIFTGREIYCRDRLFQADFIEKVFKEYGDFQIDLKQIYRDYDRGLREELLND